MPELTEDQQANVRDWRRALDEARESVRKYMGLLGDAQIELSEREQDRYAHLVDLYSERAVAMEAKLRALGVET